MACLIRKQFKTDEEREFFNKISNRYYVIIEPTYGPENDLPRVSLTIHSRNHIYTTTTCNYYNHIDKLPKRYDSLESYYCSKCEELCAGMKKELELIELILDERRNNNE